MRAIVRFKDGVVQFTDVYAYQNENGAGYEIPVSITVQRRSRTVVVFFNRILERRWNDIPEYIEPRDSQEEEDLDLPDSA